MEAVKFSDEYLKEISQMAVNLLKEKNLKISLAESCTGGMISQYITSVSGSSEVYEYGICSYSERIKTKELSVPAEMIERYGVVSACVAEEMSKGVINKSDSDVSIAVTGIAGPGGATEETPIGTVYMCINYKGNIFTENLKLYKAKNRDEVRKMTTACALQKLITIIKKGDMNNGNE